MAERVIREVVIGGVRMPYLDGHRSDFGVRLLTTKAAAMELEAVRKAQDSGEFFLEAPGGETADAWAVWLEAIDYTGDGLRATVTLRFRL